MAKAQKFEELAIFQMARELCKEVYKITKEKEFSKDSRFVQQIHASSGSVMDNIAEGFEREGNKEFVNRRRTDARANTMPSSLEHC